MVMVVNNGGFIETSCYTDKLIIVWVPCGNAIGTSELCGNLIVWDP